MNLETRLPTVLWDAVRTNYEKRMYTSAILDASYFLSELLRTKSGTEGDGAALVGQALGGPAPKIKLNRMQTESERNIQRGMEQLLRGFYGAIRNPRSHDKFIDSEEDAQALILLVGYVVRQLDQARSQFSRPEFLVRVLDPDFVPQARYAELLVAEIPARERMEVWLDLYRDKERWKPKLIRHFLAALMATFDASEMKQVSDVISDELKTTDVEANIRMVLGSFSASLWPTLQEAARLRVENKIIRSIDSGRYDRRTGRCIDGALATWATGLLSHMTLKAELLDAVANKLWSKSADERNYVLRYFFGELAQLSPTMPPRIRTVLCHRLKQGDDPVHTDLMFEPPWPEDTWSEELKVAFASFKPAEPAKEAEDDDDIPF